jgi:hypothetical protein
MRYSSPAQALLIGRIRRQQQEDADCLERRGGGLLSSRTDRTHCYIGG